MQHFDVEGKRHREKVGRKRDAADLYRVRKASPLAGKKLRTNVHQTGIKFDPLASEILKY